MQGRKIALDFNTSHVSINPRCVNAIGSHRIDFNTSHVSINHETDLTALKKKLFQYISCFY